MTATRRQTGGVPVSGRDRRAFDAQARALRRIERDDAPDAEGRAAARAAADHDRERAGRPPLADDVPLPEEEFYRRARALGFRRSRR